MGRLKERVKNSNPDNKNEGSSGGLVIANDGVLMPVDAEQVQGSYRAFGFHNSTSPIDEGTCQTIANETPSVLKRLKQSVQALKRMTKVDMAETEHHIEVRKYQMSLVKNKFIREQWNAKLVRLLLGLDARYERLREGVNLAKDMGEERKNKVKSDIEEQRTRYRDALRR